MPSDGHIWILGATGYVGRALGIEAMKEYPPARLITFGHRKMDARLMEESNHFVCPLNEISEELLERYPPKKIFHCITNFHLEELISEGIELRRYLRMNFHPFLLQNQKNLLWIQIQNQ